MKKYTGLLLILIQLALVVGLMFAVSSGRLPLGVKGEWEWMRIRQPLDILYPATALFMVLIYATYALVALKKLASKPKALGLVLGLVPMAILTQIAIQEAAPEGYGLAKWAIALANKGSSGYHSVAKAEIQELGPFLKDYPIWIKKQDALHIGTHPPGLLVFSWTMSQFMKANPDLAKTIVSFFPATIKSAFESFAAHEPLAMTDRAALAFTGFLILICSCLTVVPLFYLARSKLDLQTSWIAAVLWPLVPATMLFQPTADTAFPLLSTSALALAAWSGRRSWLAILVGVVLGIGTQLTLAFFPVGLIVAILYAVEPQISWRDKAISVGLTGVGFLGITGLAWSLMGANPLAIWVVNAANHSRFYQQYPRSYLAWVIENPIELAIAIGLPIFTLIICGFTKGPKVAWITLGLMAFLTVSGKNLSEIARLWIPLMPPLVAMAAVGFQRLAVRPPVLGVAILLLALQTLFLEYVIQVVYPI
jgi:hypothetical protein